MRALHLTSDVGSQLDLCGSIGAAFWCPGRAINFEAGVQGDGERSTAQYSRDA